jgi:hypothetical protein
MDLLTWFIVSLDAVASVAVLAVGLAFWWHDTKQKRNRV